MADRFEELRTFVAVVETGGFAAASERLGLVKSAVSRRVGELEARIGAPLLDRTGRRLSVTPAGSEIHRRAVRLLAELDGIASGLDGSRRRLRLGMPDPALVGLVAPAVDGFLSRNPEVRVAIVSNENDADLIISTRAGGMPFSRVREVCCGVADYASRSGPAGLRAVVMTKPGSPLVRTDLEASGMKFVGYVEVGDLRSALDLVTAGAAVAVLPEFMVRSGLAEGRLAEVPLPSASTVQLSLEISDRGEAEMAQALAVALREHSADGG